MEFYGICGLTSNEVAERKKTSIVVHKWKLPFWLTALIHLLLEPMVVLLVIASIIYLANGQLTDAMFLLASIVLLTIISLYQSNRTHIALDSLLKFSTDRCKVIRNGQLTEILASDLVRGDAMVIEEGELIPADGKILHANDFSVNESVLTGESFPVSKNQDTADRLVYQGTAVHTGLSIAEVSATGDQTRFSSLAKSLDKIEIEKTPLEKQVKHFVVLMAFLGGVIFALDWLLNYFQSYSLKDSLLEALTLAMSVIPEEIPVAYTTFMAIGAWKLMKMGVIVKNIKTVEALGSATVICLDKTGTITENKMTLAKLWSFEKKRIADVSADLTDVEYDLITTAMWASEPIPFDTMEESIHAAYKKIIDKDQRPDYHMTREYPLSGTPPMMTHIFTDGQGHQTIACKGAPEAIFAVCGKTNDTEAMKALSDLTSQGYRVLGVAKVSHHLSVFPATQQEIPFTFSGLIAFYDPPKKNIKKVLQSFYRAGITVKILTGDNPLTSSCVAGQIGMNGRDHWITGSEIMKLSDRQLLQKVAEFNLFTRMFPEAKLRVINALKSKGEVVAMTGDGVNDAPALKSAHIGISMGKAGAAITNEAGTLILLKDDLRGMVTAIAQGRRIYSNLKKAVRYIISIHLPILIIVFIPLLCHWQYPNLFAPVHIIFLELIMGPTCSLIYENEPMEKDTMKQKPRPFSTTFFSGRELIASGMQGLVIAFGLIFVYRYALAQRYDLPTTRSMVFATLMIANTTLTLVNRSFHHSVLATFKNHNNLVWLIISISIMILLSSLYIPSLSDLMGLRPLGISQLIISVSAGVAFVAWFEIFKWIKNSSNN